MYIFVCCSFCRFLDDSRPEFCLNIFPMTKKKKKKPYLPAIFYGNSSLYPNDIFLKKKDKNVSIIKPKLGDQKYDMKASE